MTTMLPGRSPLALIAIFAGTIEASALASLPMLESAEKQIYVWFLVGFPPFLTLLFFITLNFNHRALFAPSRDAYAGSAVSNNEKRKFETLHLNYSFNEPVQVIGQGVKQALEFVFQQQRQHPTSCRTIKIDIHQ